MIIIGQKCRSPGNQPDTIMLQLSTELTCMLVPSSDRFSKKGEAAGIVEEEEEYQVEKDEKEQEEEEMRRRKS